ncbi:hypothetical protein PSA7680_00508 [Pseudoruegeria aquimaris]|uniref:DUF2065 domain-containing protein n=1 Tax=Pseudoruegeria aquimaris TaxID=393663 RepID=A0A1Y5RGA7_9RHOB|nr:DUF2065 domain-containing protein [Pseudoruegeria aquimaris]SLN16842.1 hypothetical protein PSA7680_00508 [Pseudoruegeria aquimaris]
MIETILLALGLVLFVEGLVFALAPSRLDELVKLIASLPRDTRRLIGLFAMGGGFLLIWLSGAV